MYIDKVSTANLKQRAHELGVRGTGCFRMLCCVVVDFGREYRAVVRVVVHLPCEKLTALLFFEQRNGFVILSEIDPHERMFSYTTTTVTCRCQCCNNPQSRVLFLPMLWLRE